MMMQHYFDIDIAQMYGVNAAIILQNLGHWIMRNEANNINFHDGYYWTFNSRRAYRELFPYMSDRQIETAFKKLIDDGLVITGNYNEARYDRTLWYALTQKGKSILHIDEMDSPKMLNGFHQNVKSIPSKCEMDSPKMLNGFHQNVKPIPNINTDINTDINSDKNTTYSLSTGVDPEPKATVSDVVNLFHEICKSYPKVRSISDNRRKAINARLRSHSMDEVREVFEKAENSSFLKGSNKRNWSANLDWLMNDTNFCKVLDGNYDDKSYTARIEEREPESRPIPTEEEFDIMFGKKVDNG